MSRLICTFINTFKITNSSLHNSWPHLISLQLRKHILLKQFQREKSIASVRIQIQISCVTVDHSNHVAKVLMVNPTARLLGMALSLDSSPFYFLRAGHQCSYRHTKEYSRYSSHSQRPLRHYLITSDTIKIKSKGKIPWSARIRTHIFCMTVDHSNHVSKELFQQ